MHELSIAHTLVEIASKTAEDAGISRVKAVHLRLGVLSGVVKDALLFCYDVATNGSPLAESRLVVEELPLIISCPHCQSEQTLENVQTIYCSQCRSCDVEVIQGRELQIFTLEYEDAVTVA